MERMRRPAGKKQILRKAIHRRVAAQMRGRDLRGPRAAAAQPEKGGVPVQPGLIDVQPVFVRLLTRNTEVAQSDCRLWASRCIFARATRDSSAGSRSNRVELPMIDWQRSMQGPRHYLSCVAVACVLFQLAAFAAAPIILSAETLSDAATAQICTCSSEAPEAACPMHHAHGNTEQSREECKLQNSCASTDLAMICLPPATWASSEPKAWLRPTSLRRSFPQRRAAH